MNIVVNGKKKDKSSLNFFFRDDSEENSVHEVSQNLSKAENIMLIDIYSKRLPH